MKTAIITTIIGLLLAPTVFCWLCGAGLLQFYPEEPPLDLTPHRPALGTVQEQIDTLREDHNDLAEFTYRELETLCSGLNTEAYGNTCNVTVISQINDNDTIKTRVKTDHYGILDLDGRHGIVGEEHSIRWHVIIRALYLADKKKDGRTD